MSAVTFDFGQTLAELDHEMLARRVAERGVALDPAKAREHTAAAWDAYGEAKRAGLVARDAWCTFMRTLLELSGVPSVSASELASWLFEEQPARNLWRKPIPGMFELVRELRQQGVSVGIVSNSEGRLAELVAELGHAKLFPVIADSGRLGFEKPDRRIFDWAARRLGTTSTEIVHVGDAWEADVVGALAAGGRAIWFAPADDRELERRVLSANSADQVRGALAAFGVL